MAIETSDIPQDAPPAPADAAPDPPANATANGNGNGPRLSLTDFLDLRTLQEIQDGFSAVTHLWTVIADADGRPLTQPTDADTRQASDQVLDFLIGAHDGDGQPTEATDAGATRFVAPIIVEGETLGSITIERDNPAAAALGRPDALAELARRIGVGDDQVEPLIEAVRQACGPNRAAGVQLLYLLANSIARLCYQEYQLRQRVEELSTLYQLSTALTARGDLQGVLDGAARSAADALRVKAASIRLLDAKGKQLVPKATFNLSPAYLTKGPLVIERSTIYQEALRGKVVYVEDLPTDPRVIYPDYARREGLASMIVAPMMVGDRAIGLVQLFTEQKRRFSKSQIELVKAVAHVLGAVIERARLDEEHAESVRVQRQLQMAAKVQQRMLPHDLPHLPPFDIAAKYVPSFELGGDFYDFICLDGNLGIGVGDVVGKGIAASLLMASVRSALRAFAQDVYDIDEIISRVNVALCRDTLDNEFATLWYGVLDPQSRRLTYCNAGHEPPLLLRGGKFVRMETGGMIVGVDPVQPYVKALIDLQPGDVMAIFTDGLVDAQDEAGRRFGRERVREALIKAGAGVTAHDVLNQILWELRQFVGEQQRVDDTTLVVVKVGGV